MNGSGDPFFFYKRNESAIIGNPIIFYLISFEFANIQKCILSHYNLEIEGKALYNGCCNRIQKLVFKWEINNRFIVHFFV
ncbi:hypothetical protein BFP49_02675 [Bacillus licheniformis]|nr:hypothetical protein BFP49_02675 [Bacillus licheniformis]